MAHSSNGEGAGLPRSLTARIVEIFLTSKLSVLFLIASLAAGIVALAVTPREEEPQIVVPFADVMVRFPGATAEEVEKLVSTPLEAKLWDIRGRRWSPSASTWDRTASGAWSRSGTSSCPARTCCLPA
jgi:Cu/Ag efflux pump CusA